jgi:purine nucleoside permease
MSPRQDDGYSQRNDGVNSVRPRAVLLPAFRTEDDSVDEVSPWLSRYDFRDRHAVPGVPEPIYFDPGRQIALAVTGIGNVEATATVDALVTSSILDCEHAYFLTVGSAGTSPEVGTLGSVFVNDYIVDWDQKHRLDPVGAAEHIRPFPFKQATDVCKELNPALVAAAVDIGSRVDLIDSARMWTHREEYGSAAACSSPSVAAGTSVSGSEFWHGARCSSTARQLAEEYGASTYCTTEMEGYGTAVALERHGLLDRYLSLRGVSNFDRPAPGQDIRESIEQEALGFEVCMENVTRVGSSILSEIIDNWGQWGKDVPEQFGAATL